MADRQDAHIRFASDVLRRLGEELNPSVDQGILELVKNSYDANAKNCTVQLTGTELPGGTITITDNGDGMAPDDITDGWLVLGRSRKDPARRTRLNRMPAGSKGLGRLAALRLGEFAALRTISRDAPGKQHDLKIDWHEFENANLVEEVPLQITTTSTESDPGTVINIERLRSRLGRMDVKRLARAMLLLADPFGEDDEGFQPRLLAEEFQDLANLVEQRYFTEAEFHLIAEVDADGKAMARVEDGYGAELFSASHEDLVGGIDGRTSDFRYSCPEAQLDFWAFSLSATNFQVRAVSLNEVREWLNNFGGVHLYINGLRVAPYGNPGNDWLDINLRRSQRQEERPSTNNSIGRVRVHDSRSLLQQKTDRSGIIEGDAFSDLRRFASDALEFMARRRLKEAERRRQQERTKSQSSASTSRRVLSRAIQESDSENRPELEQAFQRYEKANERQINALRREVELYRTLSTAGITAATFAHESAGSPLKVLGQALSAIERRGPRQFGDRFGEVLGDQLRAIRKSMGSLAVLGSVTLSLIESDKRRLRRVQLHDVIRETLLTFQPFFDQRQVNVEVELSSTAPYLRASRASIESVITNLINNSLVAFEDKALAKRTLRISTELVNQTATLRVDDNGPGIVNLNPEDIWLPGQTSRANGTGLGLTIVRDAISDLGGKVHAEPHGPLGGARFEIEIPVIGA